MNIYDILFPPDSKYLGWVQIATLTKDKKMVSLGYADFTEIKDKAENLKIYKTQDYYIMMNTVKKFTHRSADNLFSLNNLALDFDIHSNLQNHEKELLIDEFVWRIKRDLFSTYELPFCNVVHYTGRGVQLIWHLESASAELLFQYKRAVDYIAIIIREFLKEYPTLQRHIEIDTTASFNAVGLFRMFNTYNTKAKLFTVTEILHDRTVNLNALVDELKQNDAIKIYLKRKEQIKNRYKKTETLNNDYQTEKIGNSYSALHYKRIKVIEELVKDNPEVTGKRDMMLFLAFNSARQIYPFETAKKICRRINASFSEPLKDLNYIFNQPTTYQMKNSTFFEKLGVSQDELVNMGKYELSRPNITRDLAREQHKAEIQMKKDVASKLLRSGIKQKEIAERTGLSLSTVSRISAEIKKRKKKRK